MKLGRILAATMAVTALASSMAMAIPSAQICDTLDRCKRFQGNNPQRNQHATLLFTKQMPAPAPMTLGVLVGVLPFESLKLEVGFDYLTSNLQKDNFADAHPFYLNAKLATPEDLGFKGMPAFAVGAYNLGTYDKPEVNGSTRQNLVYGLAAKTCPVIGRISAGGYLRLQKGSGQRHQHLNTDQNSGVMLSWDRTMAEISDKLWFGDRLYERQQR